ncbi:metallophosphoesterase family protein [Lacrimispora sp. 210928-DFI.3.58]|uniref:metallophosphoesterase family protein n=1 Tax=Lacrimispora sp. 210928-DFI.3.58 TaxID=2883214 RepID=UPI0015B6576A|nr:metallophosphoesterase [Lacrimispora sp. 210928-DFI.3.58]MCB7318152.1 metallophosphoesterase [Lacrimispora sp. 210928-DFI.3.58]
MKFIHTGDIHWGMCPDAGKPWGKERAQAIKDTFRAIVAHAKDMDADCLFISGDLFHRQPLMKDLKEVNYLFSTIPTVKVILIAGNHDRIRDNSALLSFTWAPNVTFLMDGKLTSVYFEDINTEVYGFSYHTAEIKSPLLEDIQVPLNNRIQILMAHGGDASHLPMNYNSLELSPFSYIALGHIHKPQVLAERKMAYCGSPEPLDLTETGPHGFFAGEIHPVTRKITQLDFIPLASLQYIPLAVSISKNTTNGELSDRIAREIEARGSQNIYRFRIKGMRDPDISFDLEPLMARFRIAEIIDDSEPQYDFSALFAEHSSDMIGFFIQALQKEQMSPVEKKALHYGVNALLHTTDERS